MPASDFFAFRRFRLELDGIVQGAFREFEPPALETAVEIGADNLTHPGATRRTAARLVDGIANTRELVQWFSSVLAGKPLARTVIVLELDDAGEERIRHELSQAWPVKVRLATLSADHWMEVDAVELAVDRWRATLTP